MALEGETSLPSSVGYAVQDGGQPPPLAPLAPAVAADTLSSGASGASPSRLGQRQRLVDLIQLHGRDREDQRSAEIEEIQRSREANSASGEAPVIPSTGSRTNVGQFCADLVFREEETGFELWLGSLDDALSLEGLNERDITGILNCAVDESRRECATFRCIQSADNQVVRSRRRTHARGASLADDAQSSAKRRNLPMDVIRGLVEFNSFWYSEMLDYDMSYYELEALDEDGYRMDTHFEEVCVYLNECRQECRKVLVHCIMGINRSSVALVAFLCRELEMELGHAVSLVSQHRGYILSNDSFVDQLIAHFAPKEVGDTTQDKTIAED